MSTVFQFVPSCVYISRTITEREPLGLMFPIQLKKTTTAQNRPWYRTTESTTALPVLDTNRYRGDERGERKTSFVRFLLSSNVTHNGEFYSFFFSRRNGRPMKNKPPSPNIGISSLAHCYVVVWRRRVAQWLKRIRLERHRLSMNYGLQLLGFCLLPDIKGRQRHVVPTIMSAYREERFVLKSIYFLNTRQLDAADRDPRKWKTLTSDFSIPF